MPLSSPMATRDDLSAAVEAARPQTFEGAGDGVATSVVVDKLISDKKYCMIFYDSLPVPKAGVTLTANTPDAGKTTIDFGFVLGAGVAWMINA